MKYSIVNETFSSLEYCSLKRISINTEISQAADETRGKEKFIEIL